MRQFIRFSRRSGENDVAPRAREERRLRLPPLFHLREISARPVRGAGRVREVFNACKLMWEPCEREFNVGEEGKWGKKKKTIFHPACIDMRVQKIKNKNKKIERGEKKFSRIRAAEGRLGGGGVEGKE